VSSHLISSYLISSDVLSEKYYHHSDLRYLMVANLRGEDDVAAVLKECSFAGVHVLVRREEEGRKGRQGSRGMM
jgi:hypothetical protein